MILGGSCDKTSRFPFLVKNQGKLGMTMVKDQGSIKG